MAIKATVEGDHSLCHFFPTLPRQTDDLTVPRQD